MVSGPARKVPPVCLGCGRRVTGKVRCPGCGWPFCDLKCEDRGRHTPAECSVIAPSGHRVPDSTENSPDFDLYQAIMPLRVLQVCDRQQ